MSIKSLIFLLPLLAAGVDAAAASTCAKNQCFTQVSANRFAPSAFRSSGCYSFMASTVTPTAATVTKTVANGFAVVTPGPACATTTAGPSVRPAYASACANNAQYVSACKCFGITKSTTTLKRCTTTVLKTTTLAGTTSLGGTTTFASVAAPTGCSNQGIAFAVYDNTETDSQTGYYNFEPSEFTNPIYQGTISNVQNIYVPSAQAQAPIYNQFVHASTNFVLNHVAYLFAPQSGTYTFTASNVDDIFNFWIGSNAFSGYSRENDNLDTFFFFGNVPTTGGTVTGIPGTATYTVQLVGGLYYPFRYVYGQNVGTGSFNFGITAPDGSQLFGSDQPSSPYLVRFSCDGALAPPFPAFNAGGAPVTVTPTTLTTPASTITPLSIINSLTSLASVPLTTALPTGIVSAVLSAAVNL